MFLSIIESNPYGRRYNTPFSFAQPDKLPTWRRTIVCRSHKAFWARGLGTAQSAWLVLLLLLLTSGGSLRAKQPASGESYEEAALGKDFPMEFLPIPGGILRMGSSPAEAGRSADEGPVFEVEIEPFWMSKYEVTWDQYRKFREVYEQIDTASVLHKQKDFNTPRWADAVSIPTPLWQQDSGPILSGMGEAGGYPVADISNFAARQFTKWLSKKSGRFYRLPTEAEWEYAARAGTTTAFSFGDSEDDLADYGWYYDNSFYDDDSKGHPEFGAGYRQVGLKKPNAWGLHDMHGNVSEWVIDQYLPEHYAKFAGKRVTWRDAVAWPDRIFPRVARGGNWNSEAAQCRSAARLPSDPSWQRRDPQLPKSIWWYTDSFHVGFRIVRPEHEPSDEEKLRFWEADNEIEEFVLKTNDKIIRVMVEPVGDGS
jgi:formylglycine-generating enzyme required for sulfatase activity